MQGTWRHDVRGHTKLCSIDIIRVPGAYEIPVIVSNVIKNSSPSCIIALGLVIKGATDHADLIGQSVTQSLQQLAIDSLVPVIHEVLLVEDEKQAYARCIGDQLNRGREAAQTAVTMIEISNDLSKGAGRSISK